MSTELATKRLGVSAALPIEDQLKEAQLIKLSEEVGILRKSKWTFDAVSKIVIALLALATAAWAFVLGIPQAKIDTYEAQQKLTASQSALDKKTAELSGVDRTLAATRAEVEDLQKVKVSAAKDVEEFQRLLANLKTDDPVLRLAVEKASKPIVFIQFAGSISRSVIDGLRAGLGAAGFSAQPAVRRNTARPNEVRYQALSAKSEATARKIRDAVIEYFKVRGLSNGKTRFDNYRSGNTGCCPI